MNVLRIGVRVEVSRLIDRLLANWAPVPKGAGASFDEMPDAALDAFSWPLYTLRETSGGCTCHTAKIHNH